MVVRTFEAGMIFSEMFRAPTPLMMSTYPTGPCIPPGFTTGTPSSQAPETHAAGDGEALWAWGIKFTRVGRQDLDTSAGQLY